MLPLSHPALSRFSINQSVMNGFGSGLEDNVTEKPEILKVANN